MFSSQIWASRYNSVVRFQFHITGRGQRPNHRKKHKAREFPNDGWILTYFEYFIITFTSLDHCDIKRSSEYIQRDQIDQYFVVFEGFLKFACFFEVICCGTSFDKFGSAKNVIRAV